MYSLIFKTDTESVIDTYVLSKLSHFQISHFYWIEKTAAKQNTRKQSNVTTWNLKKLH